MLACASSDGKLSVLTFKSMSISTSVALPCIQHISQTMALGMLTSSTATPSAAMLSPGHRPSSLVHSLHPLSPPKQLASQAHPHQEQALFRPSSASRAPGAITSCASGGTTRQIDAGRRRRRSLATQTGCVTLHGRRISVFLARTWRLRRRTAPFSYGRRTLRRSLGLRHLWTLHHWGRLPHLAHRLLRPRALLPGNSRMSFGAYLGAWLATFLRLAAETGRSRCGKRT